jgi:hypothetical protein
MTTRITPSRQHPKPRVVSCTIHPGALEAWYRRTLERAGFFDGDTGQQPVSKEETLEPVASGHLEGFGGAYAQSE